jgi:hypothetical protein
VGEFKLLKSCFSFALEFRIPLHFQGAGARYSSPLIVFHESDELVVFLLVELISKVSVILCSSTSFDLIVLAGLGKIQMNFPAPL